MEGGKSRNKRPEGEGHVMNSTLEQKSGLGVSEPERVEGNEMYQETFF